MAQAGMVTRRQRVAQGPGVKHPGHNVDILAQVAQDFPGIFRRILKGDQLEFQCRDRLVHAGPQVYQKLTGGCTYPCLPRSNFFDRGSTPLFFIRQARA